MAQGPQDAVPFYLSPGGISFHRGSRRLLSVRLLRGISKDQVVGFKLRDIQASKAFILDDGAHYEMVVTLRSYAEGTKSYSNTWDEFRISSYATGRGWLEHCRGLVSIKKPEVSNPVWDSRLRGAAERRKIIQNASDAEDVPLDSFYSELEGTRRWLPI